MFARTFLKRALSLSVGSIGSYSNYSNCVDNKSSNSQPNGMKNINSFFKPASEQAKKFHALTEDARYMESQNKLNEAKVVKEKARLADIDVKAKRLEVSRAKKRVEKRALDESDPNISSINNFDVVNFPEKQPEKRVRLKRPNNWRVIAAAARIDKNQARI
jgi:hypothetical protein